jgi:2',3'-cyclic-nucleotide 2'-phosphodiesterase (5'-nucleotidase family)
MGGVQKALIQKNQEDENVLFDAGDIFQGTLILIIMEAN